MLKVNQSISASPYPSPLADGAFKADLKVDQRLDLSQQTPDIDPMFDFDQCWASVVDGGPKLVQHWVDVSCSLG